VDAAREGDGVGDAQELAVEAAVAQRRVDVDLDGRGDAGLAVRKLPLAAAALAIGVAAVVRSGAGWRRTKFELGYLAQYGVLVLLAMTGWRRACCCRRAWPRRAGPTPCCRTCSPRR